MDWTRSCAAQRIGFDLATQDALHRFFKLHKYTNTVCDRLRCGRAKHAILNIKLLALINTHTGLVNSRVVRSMVRSGCPL
jgi:hypothetical protein